MPDPERAYCGNIIESRSERMSGLSTPEAMVADLVTHAQAALDAHEVLPDTSDGSRTMQMGRLVDDASLKETENSETGRREYEYADRDPRDRAQKRIFTWDEGGDTITRWSGFMNRPDIKPVRGATRHPSVMDHRILRGRIRRLAQLSKTVAVHKRS